MKRIAELDGVRALAIALVIGCHYPWFCTFLGGLSEFGWAGVDIFFVLSGYLITTILLDLRGQPRAYRAFYARRVRRIFPAYFITVFLAALYELVFHFHLDTRTLLFQAGFLTAFHHCGDIFPASFHALRTHTVPSLWAAQQLPPGLPGVTLRSFRSALSHTWSLSVEEWFYILWAPTVLAFGRRGIVAGAITALLLGTLLRWTSGADGTIWCTNFFCRFDLLGIGALLALWRNFGAQQQVARRRAGDLIVRVLAIAAAIGLAAILFHERPFLGREIRDAHLFAAFGTTFIGLAAAGLVAHLIHASGGPSPIARLFRWSPLVWIGRRSYTIYLAHLPWYWVVAAISGVVGRSSWLAALVALALTLITAALSWRYIEEPLLRPRSVPLANPVST